MMKHLIFTLLASLILTTGVAQKPIKVLFFGNSYTYGNDLPNTFRRLASSLGDSVIVSSLAPGGQRLSGHAGNPSTYSTMKSDNWDYIVFQEQSQIPSFPKAMVDTLSIPFAKQLCDSVYALPFCAKPVFFMTWGRENGDQSNCQFYPPLCTYEGMQLELRKNYLRMAYDNNAFASPVGMVWREVRRKWPNLKLYTSDQSHPNANGTFVAACTFYATLMGKSPAGASYNGGINASDADSIKKAAGNIVLDSLKTWNIIRDTLTADFQFAVRNDTVDFHYTGDTALAYYWDFGDGNNGTLLDPTHIYGRSDTFKVTLVSTSKCLTDTVTKTVVISGSTPTGLQVNFSTNIRHDTVDFVYSGSAVDSLVWDFGDGNADTGKTPTHIYGVSDTFSVKLKGYYLGMQDSISKNVIVNLPTPSIRVSFFTTINHDTVQFVYTGTMADSLSWDFGDGTFDTATNPVHIYGKEDTFLVSLTGYFSGAVDSTSRTVFTSIVEGPSSVEIGKTDSQVRVFPNPTSGMLFVKAASKIRSIKVLTVSGKEILSWRSINSTSFSRSFLTLQAGIYFLHITTDKEFTIQKLVVKQ